MYRLYFGDGLHQLHAMGELAAMEFLLDKMKTITSSDEFFGSMQR